MRYSLAIVALAQALAVSAIPKPQFLTPIAVGNFFRPAPERAQLVTAVKALRDAFQKKSSVSVLLDEYEDNVQIKQIVCVFNEVFEDDDEFAESECLNIPEEDEIPESALEAVEEAAESAADAVAEKTTLLEEVLIKAREKIAELAPEARKAESDLTVTAKIDQAKEAIRMFVGGPSWSASEIDLEDDIWECDTARKMDGTQCALKATPMKKAELVAPPMSAARK